MKRPRHRGRCWGGPAEFGAVVRVGVGVGVVGVADKLLKDSKEAILMARWREPTLSLHGIEGAFYEPGAKTVIPRCAARIFSKLSVRWR